jgi:hypothetical protein
MDYLLSIMSSDIHVVANDSSSFFLWLIGIHCIYVSHYLYEFIYWWTFRMILSFEYCEYPTVKMEINFCNNIIVFLHEEYIVAGHW